MYKDMPTHNHLVTEDCTAMCTLHLGVPREGGLSAPKPLRHKTSAERKAEPIHSGPMSYHPDALAAHARLCVAGNTKHNGPGTPLSWARGKSNDHLECAARHMLTPDAIDPETGETELTAAFWRLGCALQLQQERLLKEKGIMPYSGITP